jgi:hypothetical protein
VRPVEDFRILEVEPAAAEFDVPAAELPGDLHDEAQVALDHASARSGVAFARQPAELLFLGRGEQRREADFAQIQFGRVGRRAIHVPAAAARPAETQRRWWRRLGRHAG